MEKLEEDFSWTQLPSPVLCTQWTKLFRKTASQTPVDKRGNRCKGDKSVPSCLSSYRFGDQEYLTMGILGNYQEQRLLSQTFHPEGFGAWGGCSCSPPTHLDLISHLKLSCFLSGGWWNPRAAGAFHSWFMRCRSQVQTCQGVKGLPVPHYRACCSQPSPAIPWGRNARTASLQISAASTARERDESRGLLVCACQHRKNTEGRAEIPCEFGICKNLPDLETLQRADRGWRCKG